VLRQLNARPRHFTLALLILAAATLPLGAQEQAVIEGTVRDGTGLVVQNATITVTGPAGQAPRTATTDADGRYRLDVPAPGRLAIAAQSPGFARSTRDLTVTAERRLTLDFVLHVDALTQTVTVNAQTPDALHTLTAMSALRTDVPLIEVPQAVSVVPHEVLEQQQIRSIGEVAKTVSGMGRAVGYAESADKFMIRGLLIDYSLKNGFKNSSVLSLTDVANVERVEVLKGPSSLLYGRIEPGGVVNLVTKQPLAVRRQTAELVLGRYGLTRGAFDTTGPIAASASYRLVGALEHADSHRDFVGTDTAFVAPSFSWKASDRTTLTVEGEALRMSGTPDAGLPSHPISFTLPVQLSVGEEADRIRNTNWRGAYYLTHRFSDRWSLTHATSLLGADATRTHVYAPNGALLPDGHTFARQVLDEQEGAHNLFSRVDLLGTLGRGGQKHVLLASVEGGRERYDNGISVLGLAPIDLFEPRYGAPYPIETGDPQQVRHQGADSLGLVIQDQWTVTSRWKVTLGGRADVARTMYLDVVNRPPTSDPSTPPVSVGPPPGGGSMPPPGGGGPMPGPGTGGGAPVTAPDPTRRESTEWVHAFSPRAGLVFQPTPLVALYASYSRSFNPLQLIHYINLVNIKPFRATQYEGGLKLDLFGARLQATLAVFGLEATGYVLPTGQFGTVTYDGFKKSSGVEVETTSHTGPLTVRTSYTFNEGDKRVGFPGQSLMNAPRHSGATWATWSARTGRWQGLTIGGGAFLVGERVANLFDSLEIPAYARMDALAGYERARWAVQLNLKNVTSERYFETDAVQGLLLPGSPRHAEVTFRVKF
jgi:iron complex outermembrane receptor protein